MKYYEEYVNRVLDAEEFPVGLSSKMAMIKDQMEFKTQRGTSKMKFELEQKMLIGDRRVEGRNWAPKITNIIHPPVAVDNAGVMRV